MQIGCMGIMVVLVAYRGYPFHFLPVLFPKNVRAELRIPSILKRKNKWL